MASGVYKRKRPPWNKGLKNWMPPESKQSMIEKKKGVPSWNKGKKTPEEVREKQRLAKLRNPTRYWLGKKRDLETREKMSKNRMNLVTGKEHWKWIGDRELLKKYKDCQEKRSVCYKRWRKNVIDRDNWKCRIGNSDCSGRLEVHHILGFTEHPELRYDINNGITLCHFHHPKVREEEKRLIPTFKELVSVSKIIN